MRAGFENPMVYPAEKNMNRNYGAVVMAVGIASTGVAYAEGPVKPWEGEVEAGLVATSGNTDTQNISAKGKVVNNRDKWRHTGKLEALQSETGNVTTAERYLASGKSDYKLSDIDYLFGAVDYEDDRFSGYDYRATEVLGYGRRVLNTPTMTLELEIGAGSRQSKLTSTGDTDSEGLARLAGNYNWKISDTTTFGEELTIDAGSDSTITKSVTSLKSQVAGNLATKITFTIRNNSDVPVSVEKTDRETAITLVYGF